MVSRIQKNIVKEILRECYPKDIHPNEDFVTFFLKLLLLDPNWGITENLLNSRTNVQRLVKYVISELGDKASVKMMTLKMQFYFTYSIDNLNKVVGNNFQNLVNRLAPIREEILATVIEYPVHIEHMMKAVTIYCIFLSGLGNPMKEPVYIEGLSALKSIISDEELTEFSFLPREAKLEQLNQMSRIITGIRLFNKHCDKGGVDIPDLAELYRNAAKIVREEMEFALRKVLEKVGILEKLFDKCLRLKKNVDAYYFEYIYTPKGGREFLEIAKDQLIHYRQYELFIRKVLHLFDVIDVKVDHTDLALEDLMNKTDSIVRARLAVPVTIIFPLFEQLSAYWTIIQEQVILLARYSTIVANLETYCRSMNVSTQLFEDLVESKLSYAEEEGGGEEIGQMLLESENPEVEVMETSEVLKLPEADDIEVKYLGFCCWKLVEAKGLLLPGDPHLGVGRYRNDWFVFSSQEAAACFARKPEKYIKHVLNMARKKPQLINFLHLQEDLEAVSDVKQLVEEKIKVTKVADKCSQSEDSYVIPPYKDKSLTWNVWDLKRDLLLMANLTKCQTTSTQTVKSHSTSAIRVQTVTLKEQETQTTIDKQTAVPTPSNFIYGLRGRKDGKQFILTLTRPVHE